MNRFGTIAFALVASLTMAAVAIQATDQDAPAVTDYTIDGGHSTVLFRVKHLGVSPFWGRFNKVSGSYTVDQGDPNGSSVELTIPTASVDTNSEGRDGHLKNPDFFDVEKHPEMTFKSTAIEALDETTFKVTGDLTLLGVTKSVSGTVEWYGEAQTRMGYRSGFEATFEFNRSDFGMMKYVAEGALGDTIRVVAGIEGIKAAE
ncbi:MAG: YceI family protein [Planctomycetota bacterium]|jgi:polyisoprenoid-binding protein YceI